MSNLRRYKEQLKTNDQKRKRIEEKIKDSYISDIIRCIIPLTTNKKMISIYEETGSDNIKKALLDIINSRQFFNFMKKTLKEQETFDATDDHSVNTTAANSDANNTQSHNESIETTDAHTSGLSDDNIILNHYYSTSDTYNS